MERHGKKIDVLLLLFQDVQENIRFIESKVGVVIILLTGLIALFIGDIESYIIYFEQFSIILKLLFGSSIILIALSIIFIAKIIYPVNNPVNKIPEPYANYPNIYQGKNVKFNSSLVVNKFDLALETEDNINKVLELEYLKTSYVRNVKANHFKTLVIICILTLLSVISQFILTRIEEHEIIKKEIVISNNDSKKL